METKSKNDLYLVNEFASSKKQYDSEYQQTLNV
jgi:hypothetical protein